MWEVILYVALGVLVVYVLSRIGMKGILHEIDDYLYKKYKQKMKHKQNGTEEEKN
jgi:hypothetical protein